MPSLYFISFLINVVTDWERFAKAERNIRENVWKNTRLVFVRLAILICQIHQIHRGYLPPPIRDRTLHLTKCWYRRAVQQSIGHHRQLYKQQTQTPRRPQHAARTDQDLICK